MELLERDKELRRESKKYLGFPVTDPPGEGTKNSIIISNVIDVIHTTVSHFWGQ